MSPPSVRIASRIRVAHCCAICTLVRPFGVLVRNCVWQKPPTPPTHHCDWSDPVATGSLMRSSHATVGESFTAPATADQKTACAAHRLGSSSWSYQVPVSASFSIFRPVSST